MKQFTCDAGFTTCFQNPRQRGFFLPIFFKSADPNIESVYQMVPSRGFEPPDLLQTRQVLYQLSYDGAKKRQLKRSGALNEYYANQVDGSCGKTKYEFHGKRVTNFVTRRQKNETASILLKIDSELLMHAAPLL